MRIDLNINNLKAQKMQERSTKYYMILLLTQMEDNAASPKRKWEAFTCNAGRFEQACDKLEIKILEKTPTNFQLYQHDESATRAGFTYLIKYPDQYPSES